MSPTRMIPCAAILAVMQLIFHTSAFTPNLPPYTVDKARTKGQHVVLHATTDNKKNEDNKAMAFLRSRGKVGGATAQDFINAMGVDEGPAGGKQNSESVNRIMRKAPSAYVECTKSGVIDDLSETFPFTSSGTCWAGVTDRVMGGKSSGSLTREEDLDGKTAIVLKGKVSLENNGGFVQMATDLALNPSVSQTVDASRYDGVELDIYFDMDDNGDATLQEESFNVHLKNEACARMFSSYRASFVLQRQQWTTVRLSWSDFMGKGPGAVDVPFDASNLRRIGIVAIGKEMEVTVALAGARFYNVL
mmetsp:Transcript_11766/g.17726  ORF Transcript_11766/g.17726 Transcript_11766/m.17726 type:complete len:304 (-) Transcript_11766:1725-2636(-)